MLGEMRPQFAKALAAGCSGYVTKPIDKTIFLDTVARLLPEGNGNG